MHHDPLAVGTSIQNSTQKLSHNFYSTAIYMCNHFPKQLHFAPYFNIVNRKCFTEIMAKQRAGHLNLENFCIRILQKGDLFQYYFHASSSIIHILPRWWLLSGVIIMSNAHKFVSSKTREKETSTKFEQNGLLVLWTQRRTCSLQEVDNRVGPIFDFVDNHCFQFSEK